MMKKGYVRTLEAVFAVLIIFFFIYSILPRETIVQETKPDEVRLLQEIILREIETNSEFRTQVLNDDNTSINGYVDSTLSLIGNYGYLINIQEVNSIGLPSGLPENRNVYTDSIVIGSNLNNYDPKLVTVYLWEELS